MAHAAARIVSIFFMVTKLPIIIGITKSDGHAKRQKFCGSTKIARAAVLIFLKISLAI
jgi:hypothetical protein